MGFLLSPLGDPSWLSHSDELVPPLEVDDRDPCRRMWPRVLNGDGVVKKLCLFLGNFDGVRGGGVFWGGSGTRRAREPKTPLRGKRIVVPRGCSATREPNVLVDQRLRKQSSEGELGKETGEIGVFEEVEDAKDEVESIEERGASESVLERGSATSPYIPERGVSGIAGGRGMALAGTEYVKEG